MYALLAPHHLSLTMDCNKIEDVCVPSVVDDSQEPRTQYCQELPPSNLRLCKPFHLHDLMNKRCNSIAISFRQLVLGFVAPPFESPERQH